MLHKSQCVRFRVAGTAAYMAPELLQKGKMTRAADVYSFAMIMVELFTCKRLFEGLAQQQVPASQPSLIAPPSRVSPQNMVL